MPTYACDNDHGAQAVVSIGNMTTGDTLFYCMDCVLDWSLVMLRELRPDLVTAAGDMALPEATDLDDGSSPPPTDTPPPGGDQPPDTLPPGDDSEPDSITPPSDAEVLS